MSGKVQFQHGGRTDRGKVSDISSEDHYRRRITNWLDGLDQSKRKEAFRALGLDPERDTKREIDERLKKGDVDIAGLIARTGGEKMPGCGAVVIVDVGARSPTRIISEQKTERRLKALSRVNYYFRPRTGKTRHGKERSGERKEWPGLVKRMVSLSPGDSQALIGAVKSGAMTAEEFRDHLSELSELMRDRFREATKLPGALKGLEAELIIWHLEQGCLHAHIYARDIDLSEPDHPRLGLFGCSTEVKKRSAAPRLTLNPLGVSGVAMRRHRKAGHVAPAKAFERVVRDEDGNPVLDSSGNKQMEPWLCTDWTVLEVTEGKRDAKGLGKCWDSVLADQVDGYWEGVLSTPALKRYRDEAHAKWAKDWSAECSSNLKALWAKAEIIAGPKLKELEDRIAKADADRAEKRFYDDAFASGACALAYCQAAAFAEAEGELADLADVERREREALLAEAAKAKAESATKDRKIALNAMPQVPAWLDAMRAVMRGGEPPSSLMREGQKFFRRHKVTGRWMPQGGFESCKLICDLGLNEAPAAREYLELVAMRQAAMERYVALVAESGKAAAEAYLNTQEAGWKKSVAAPAAVVPFEKVIEKEVIKTVPVPPAELEKLVESRLATQISEFEVAATEVVKEVAAGRAAAEAKAQAFETKASENAGLAARLAKLALPGLKDALLVVERAQKGVAPTSKELDAVREFVVEADDVLVGKVRFTESATELFRDLKAAGVCPSDFERRFLSAFDLTRFAAKDYSDMEDAVLGKDGMQDLLEENGRLKAPLRAAAEFVHRRWKKDGPDGIDDDDTRLLFMAAGNALVADNNRAAELAKSAPAKLVALQSARFIRD